MQSEISFGNRNKKYKDKENKMAEEKNKTEMNVEDALTQSEAFIMKNKTAIISAIVAVIVIVAGVMLYKNYISEPREQKAAAALFKGEEYFGAEDFEKALNGDSIGYAGFVKVADEYSGTKSGRLAKAYAGICYARLGKYEEAVKYLSDFDGDDQMVGPAAIGALGDCYAYLEQLDKATAAFIKAADKADNNTLSPLYLKKAGEVFEKQGKYAEAVKVYTKIKDKYFNSYQARDIDKFIDRAKIK